MKQVNPSPFHFVRQTGQKRRASTDLLQTMNIQDRQREKWLFVSPHDDDLAIGGALWMQAAVAAGIDVEVLIVTDGRMGYCTLAQRANIVKIRRAETYTSFAILGIPRAKVSYLGYPDGGLYPYQGRRKAQRGEPGIKGYTGLSNAFTYHLRRVRPTRVLVPTPLDLHPDHQVTHNELMISLFHASGQIWPELGQPIDPIQAVYEMAIYCDFSAPPNLGLRTNDAVFQTKLRSIAAYQSQLQIEQVVAQVRAAGAYEFLREVDFKFYSASRYVDMFKV